jgi:hypothetical protein
MSASNCRYRQPLCGWLGSKMFTASIILMFYSRWLYLIWYFQPTHAARGISCLSDPQANQFWWSNPVKERVVVCCSRYGRCYTISVTPYLHPFVCHRLNLCRWMFSLCVLALDLTEMTAFVLLRAWNSSFVCIGAMLGHVFLFCKNLLVLTLEEYTCSNVYFAAFALLILPTSSSRC